MAEVTYYFNSRATGNWANPDYMIDGILTNYASTNAKGTIETLNGNTCLGDDLGIMTKVEIRAYGYGDGNDQITLNGIALTMPSSPGWSSYADTGITTWAGVVALDATIQYTAVGKANIMYCAKVEIRVTYGILDVGAGPIDRAAHLAAVFPSWTIVDKNNPANASGTLHTVKVYANTNMTGLIVGTFYTTNGNTLKCRDSELVGDVEAGAVRTFTGLSIAVEEGDYIGCYYTGGAIERDGEGFAGIWWINSKYIYPNDETEYSSLVGDAISLYGYGDIGEAPAYYHGLKIQGEGELALCDVGSHPLRIRKGGVTYGIELVATNDPNASKIRIKTGPGIKAIRKYT